MFRIIKSSPPVPFLGPPSKRQQQLETARKHHYQLLDEGYNECLYSYMEQLHVRMQRIALGGLAGDARRRMQDERSLRWRSCVCALPNEAPNLSTAPPIGDAKGLAATQGRHPCC